MSLSKCAAPMMQRVMLLKRTNAKQKALRRLMLFGRVFAWHLHKPPSTCDVISIIVVPLNALDPSFYKQFSVV